MRPTQEVASRTAVPTDMPFQHFIGGHDAQADKTIVFMYISKLATDQNVSSSPCLAASRRALELPDCIREELRPLLENNEGVVARAADAKAELTGPLAHCLAMNV